MPVLVVAVRALEVEAAVDGRRNGGAGFCCSWELLSATWGFMFKLVGRFSRSTEPVREDENDRQ